MAPPPQEQYCFGPYRIGAGERLLHRHGVLVPLSPKLGETLLVLVQNAGRMVEKGDLMKAVWPDTFVEEGALTRNISLLRKTLGDTGDEPAYIETIPRRGYRFIAPVRMAAAGPARAELAAGAFPGETGKESGAATPALRPERSTAKWVIAATVLFVAGVATVAKFGVWRPDPPPQRLQQRRPAPEAEAAYLLGQPFLNRRTEDGLERAGLHFQQAIAADANYALAYSGLADSYALRGSIGTDSMEPRAAMEMAKSYARKAIELDPYLAEGHNSLANVLLSYDWDLRGAEREFRRALELNPNSAATRHWYSHYFLAAGDLGKAAEQMREALRLDPASPSIQIGIGWCHYYSKQYDQAIERFRSVAESDPALPLAHQTLGMSYEQKGLYGQAITAYKRAADLSGNSPASVAALATVYAIIGNDAESRRELNRLMEMARTRYVPALYFAGIHHARGDWAKAVFSFKRAVGERCDYLMYLRVEPRAGGLLSNPDFIRIMGALDR